MNVILTCRHLCVSLVVLASTLSQNITYAETIPATVVQHMRTIRAAPVKGERFVRELDVDGDGRLTHEDARLWQRLADAAQSALKSRHMRSSIEDGYYLPGQEAQSPFSWVAIKDDQFDLEKVPVERWIDIAIEAKWLAMQVQLLGPDVQVSDRPVGGSLSKALPGYDPVTMSPAQMCEAVSHLDLSAYRAAGLTPTATFDLDGTVWTGNIMESFWGAVIDAKIIKEEAAPILRSVLNGMSLVDPRLTAKYSANDAAREILRRFEDRTLPSDARPTAKDVFLAILQSLQGLRVDDVRKIARQAVEHGSSMYPPWDQRLFATDGCTPRVLIEQLRKQGVDVYVITATLDVLGDEGATILGIAPDHVVGSRLLVRRGKYTGVLSEGPYWLKGEIMRQWLPSPPILVFGDSPASDFSMLQQAMVAGFTINSRAPMPARDRDEAGGRLIEVNYRGTMGDSSRLP